MLQNPPMESTKKNMNAMTSNQQLQPLQSITLFNYSNTTFIPTLFYKELDKDYEQQFDDRHHPIPPLHQFVTPIKQHQGRNMILYGVELVDSMNTVASQTFVLDEVRKHVGMRWTGELMQEVRVGEESAPPLFIITKHIGEKIKLFYYESPQQQMQQSENPLQ